MQQVDGVDVWTNGDPPRRYEVIGYIEDRRHATGLVGKVRMKSLHKDAAKLAREHGGDAVILVSSENDVIGYATNASANASGNSAYGQAMTAPVAKRDSRFAVIRYLPDAPSASTSQDAQPS